MAWFALVASVAGSLMAAKGQEEAGEARQEAANAQAYQFEIEADQTRDASKAQADKIRKAAAKQRAQSDAAFAASGVSVGVGTPVKINQSIDRDAESDAYNTMLSGERQGRSLDTQAHLARKTGVYAARAGKTAATGSLLAGASSAAGQWGQMK